MPSLGQTDFMIVVATGPPSAQYVELTFPVCPTGVHEVMHRQSQLNTLGAAIVEPAG
jgi:hypothetical protein